VGRSRPIARTRAHLSTAARGVTPSGSSWGSGRPRTRTRVRRPAPVDARVGGTGRSMPSRALDQRRRGEVAVSGRRGRERLWDLAERIHPAVEARSSASDACWASASPRILEKDCIFSNRLQSWTHGRPHLHPRGRAHALRTRGTRRPADRVVGAGQRRARERTRSGSRHRAGRSTSSKGMCPAPGV